MKLLKNICVLTAEIGFILALGTAGTSDLEMETNQILMTDTQFYLRMLTAIAMLVIGSLGAMICTRIAKCKKRYRAVQRAHGTTHNQHKTVA